MTETMDLDFPGPSDFDPEAFAAARVAKLAEEAPPKPKRKRKAKTEKPTEPEADARERGHLPWVPPPRMPADVAQITSKAPPGVPTWASVRDYIEGAREYEAASLAQLELDDDGAATLASWNGTLFAAHRLAEAAQSAAVSRAYWCDAAAQVLGMLLAAPREERWPCWSCEDNPHPDDPLCEDCGGVGKVTRAQLERHALECAARDVSRLATAARQHEGFALEAVASLEQRLREGRATALLGIDAEEASGSYARSRVSWLAAVVALLTDPVPVEVDYGPPPF